MTDKTPPPSEDPAQSDAHTQPNAPAKPERKSFGQWAVYALALLGGFSGVLSLVIAAGQAISGNRAAKADRALSLTVHETDYFLNAYKYRAPRRMSLAG
jgi:hypothetical protein